MKICLEYVWIDGFENLRSKNRILVLDKLTLKLSDVPIWNFDGSSTGQALDKKESDIILKPVRIYSNPFIKFTKSYLVLCECLTIDMKPHPTNFRNDCFETTIEFKEDECLFGIEQEYTIFERKDINKLNSPYQWNNFEDPEIGGQGPYYCSIGGDRAFGRPIVEEHLEFCLYAGIDICGTNAEVMASQWEFQIGICDPVKVSDDLWLARYILQRITEKYNCYVTFHPKPFKGDWNGTGGHTNFSTKNMRNKDGLEYIYAACEKLALRHKEHMKVYGKHNEERLSGHHETSDINTFSYGVSNRGCSIRIPVNVHQNKCGYLEDRRPASNLDPYQVTNIIMKTVCSKNDMLI